MHEGFTLFTSVWVVAFASTVARAVRDGDRSGWVRCAGLGCTAGFLAVGVVAIWAGRNANGGIDADYWYSVGLASLIGCLGKEQDKVRSLAWNMVVQAMKAAVDTGKKAD